MAGVAVRFNLLGSECNRLVEIFISFFGFNEFDCFSGIAVGALLSTGSNGDNLQVPNVILQGLATGK